MAVKKWMVLAGALAFVSTGVVALGFAGNQMMHENFKKALIATGSGATGSAVNIGDSDFNIFSGSGWVKSITVPSASGSLIEVSDIVFEVKPFSLIFGTIEVKSLNIGDLKVVADITAGQSTMNKVLASALAFSQLKDASYSKVRLTIGQLGIPKGTVTVKTKIFGKPVLKSASIPPIHLTNIAGSDGGASPATIAYSILREVGSRAINNALKNL